MVPLTILLPLPTSGLSQHQTTLPFGSTDSLILVKPVYVNNSGDTIRFDTPSISSLSRGTGVPKMSRHSTSVWELIANVYSVSYFCQCSLVESPPHTSRIFRRTSSTIYETLKLLLKVH